MDALTLTILSGSVVTAYKLYKVLKKSCLKHKLPSKKNISGLCVLVEEHKKQLIEGLKQVIKL